jgi:hypothetical protein
MRKRSISILALVIAAVITFYILIVIWGTSGENNNTSIVKYDIFYPTAVDTALGGSVAQPHIDNSLPHYLYQHIADSLKQIYDERQLENRSVKVTGTSFGIFGVYSMDAPQSGNEPQKQAVNSTGKLYYLSMVGYSLPYEKKFYVQNGTYNLAVPKWDSQATRGTGFWRYGHYVRKQIPVRYSTDNKQILIPLSKQQFNVVHGMVPLVSYILIFLALYVFFGLPVHILIKISKGNAFDDINIRRFNLMFRGLLVWGLVQLLSPYILWFFFRNIIPDDFMLPAFRQQLWDNCELFIWAIAIFITGKAFQKGNKLQNEQDLTI